MSRKDSWAEAYYATECSCCNERKISEEWKEITRGTICWKCFTEGIA